jgi:hypothetical protein
MLDKLLSIFKRKPASTQPFKGDFLRPKEEPVKRPAVVLSDRKAPLPAGIQDKPPAILLPSVATVPAAASKPMEDFKPLMQLPPDIDPNQVVIVRHDKKPDGERFKYVDKPLKPLSTDGRHPELIKYEDKKDVIKYKAVSPAKQTEHEKPARDVLKYTPVRVEIKN